MLLVLGCLCLLLSQMRVDVSGVYMDVLGALEISGVEVFSF